MASLQGPEVKEKLWITNVQTGLFVLSSQRKDMVKYFREQLFDFAFIANGWLQCYGSQCVKRPIIYGYVSRLKPATVLWSSAAQTITNRPIKGVLTGPVTGLNWSFVRMSSQDCFGH